MIGHVSEHAGAEFASEKRVVLSINTQILRGVRPDVVLQRRALLLANSTGSEDTYQLFHTSGTSGCLHLAQLECESNQEVAGAVITVQPAHRLGWWVADGCRLGLDDVVRTLACPFCAHRLRQETRGCVLQYLQLLDLPCVVALRLRRLAWSVSFGASESFWIRPASTRWTRT